MRKFKVTCIYTKKDGTTGVIGRLETRAEIRNQFLLETWKRLRIFKMKSTGSPALDEQLKKELGPWL